MLTNVSSGSNIEISSSFPSFDLGGQSDVELRWMTYYQNMAGPVSQNEMSSLNNQLIALVEFWNLGRIDEVAIQQ